VKVCNNSSQGSSSKQGQRSSARACDPSHQTCQTCQRKCQPEELERERGSRRVEGVRERLLIMEK
ncbi:unnamed protein product, partial [Sphagnum jensenii]